MLYILTAVSMWTVPPSISLDVMADDLLCIRAGDPIRIPATIKGRPAPKVTWDFDGKAKAHKKNKLHTLPVDSEVSFCSKCLSSSFGLLLWCLLLRSVVL